MSCEGCPPFRPCTGGLTDTFTDFDQDDTHSWIGQQSTGGVSGVFGPTFYPGFPGVGSGSKISHLSQDHGRLNTINFWSVPIPVGTVEARLHGTVRALAGSDSIQAPDLTDIDWAIVRGTWGDAPPASLDPGVAQIAAGALDFSAAGGWTPQGEAFDTGRFTVLGAHFQFYLHFVSPPTGGAGFYRFALENNGTLGDTWALEFYGCATIPKANQAVRNEIVGSGDGVTTVYATAFAYAGTSLEVQVSGIAVRADPTDPASHLFTLSDPAPVGAPIVASYQASGL